MSFISFDNRSAFNLRWNLEEAQASFINFDNFTPLKQHYIIKTRKKIKHHPSTLLIVNHSIFVKIHKKIRHHLSTSITVNHLIIVKTYNIIKHHLPQCDTPGQTLMTFQNTPTFHSAPNPTGRAPIIKANEEWSSTHLGVDSGAGQFVLDDHHDNAEHAHDERVVADAFPLLEQGLPSAEPVANVRFVLWARSYAARWSFHLATAG